MNDVAHFRRAQDGAFYFEGLHVLFAWWSESVNEGGDCVVIWKMIVLIFKTDTKWQEKKINTFSHHYSNLFGDTILSWLN